MPKPASKGLWKAPAQTEAKHAQHPCCSCISRVYPVHGMLVCYYASAPSPLVCPFYPSVRSDWCLCFALWDPLPELALAAGCQANWTGSPLDIEESSSAAHSHPRLASSSFPTARPWHEGLQPECSQEHEGTAPRIGMNAGRHLEARDLLPDCAEERTLTSHLLCQAFERAAAGKRSSLFCWQPPLT